MMYYHYITKLLKVKINSGSALYGQCKNAYKTLLLTNSGEQAIDENRSGWILYIVEKLENQFIFY